MHDNTGPEPPKAGPVDSENDLNASSACPLADPLSLSLFWASSVVDVGRSVQLFNDEWVCAEQVKIILDANECEITITFPFTLFAFPTLL